MNTVIRVPPLWTSISLAFVGGFMDALTFVFVGGVFSSMMTGNLMILGLGLVVPQTLFRPTFNVVAILAFIAGVTLAALIPVSRKRGQNLVVAEVILLIFTAFFLFQSGPPAVFSRVEPVGYAEVLAIIGASMAMGIQSTLISRIGSVPVSTTYMTSTLIRIVSEVAGRTADVVMHPTCHITGHVSGVAGSYSRVLFPILAAFLFGAIAAGVLILSIGFVALVVPVAALVLIAVGWVEEESGGT